MLTYLSKRRHQDTLQKKKSVWRRQFDALGNVLFGNLGSWHLCGFYFDTYHLPTVHIVAAQVHPFMATVCLIAVASSSRIMCPVTLQKLFRFEENDKDLKVFTRPKNWVEDVLDKPIRSIGIIFLQLTGFKGSAANILVPHRGVDEDKAVLYLIPYHFFWL